MAGPLRGELKENNRKRRTIFVCLPLGKPQKKGFSTNGQAIKALPPPLELNGHRNFFFSLKIAENGFLQLFSPRKFWPKTALFFGKYCNK